MATAVGEVACLLSFPYYEDEPGSNIFGIMFWRNFVSRLADGDVRLRCTLGRTTFAWLRYKHNKF